MIQLAGIGAASTKTDEGGVFELAHLPEGEFRVVARKAGYQPSEVQGLTSGDAVPDLVLTRYSRVLLTVVDAVTGAPVTKYGAWLQRKSATEDGFDQDWQLRREVESSEGVIQYDEVVAGDYRVSVFSREYARVEQPLRVDPGADVPVNVALDPGARVEGVVRMAYGGEPIAGASIRLHSTNREAYDWRYNQDRKSAEDGSFALGGLVDGDYQVSVNHEDYYPDPRTRQLEFTLPLEGPLLLEFVMRPAGRLKGTVSNLKPIDRQRGNHVLNLIRIEDSGSREAGGKEGGEEAAEKRPETTSVWLDDSGKYHGTSLVPGRYRVVLTQQTWGHKQGEEVPAPPEHPLGEVEITAGKVTAYDAASP